MASLRSEVSRSLKARGYRQFERMHLLRVDGEFSVWVDTGPLESRTDIAPSVGLRHEGVEHLVPELLGVDCFDWTATVGSNVGYVLAGTYRRWVSPAPVADVLAAIDIGLERMKQFMPLDRLPAAWSIPGAQTPGWRYHEIVAYYLLGDESKVHLSIEAARASLCKTPGEVCQQFLDFERRLIGRGYGSRRGEA